MVCIERFYSIITYIYVENYLVIYHKLVNKQF